MPKLLTILTAALMLSAGAPSALAAESAEGPRADGAKVALAVTAIHATKGEGGVDPALGKLARYLTRSFKGYATFKRLAGQNEKLEAGGSARLPLPNGKDLTYRFTGVDKDGFIRIYIEVGGLKSTVRVRDGGTFFQAGRKFNKGIIVLAFDARLVR